MNRTDACATEAHSPNPTHDRGFTAHIVNDLLDHKGEWRLLGRLYAPDMLAFERADLVRKAVDCARRFGMVIEGDVRLGHRLTGWERPPLFTKPVQIVHEVEAVDRRASGGSD